MIQKPKSGPDGEKREKRIHWLFKETKGQRRTFGSPSIDKGTSDTQI